MKNKPVTDFCARLTLGLLALFAAASARTDSVESRQLDQIFPRSTLQIATPDARLHTFNVWLAEDEAQRARGLMFVRSLGQDEGMLFVYPAERPLSMWMKNTFIPLDMLFVRADGRIEHVVENTTPQSLATIESKKPALAVIELNAGTAERLKIRPGARVMHAAFKQAASK